VAIHRPKATVTGGGASGHPVPTTSGAWLEQLGLQLEEVSGTVVRGHLHVAEDHHTPWGVVHGGVFCTVVETVGSLGASAAVAGRGQVAVGTHNATDFLRPVVRGRIDVVARPVLQGKVQQLWAVDLTSHDTGKLVAQGRLRLQNIEAPGI